MKTITFSSIKGGTGKSSMCILTANYTAAAGYKVLVIDLDLQNSASFYYLDSSESSDKKNIAQALHSEDLRSNIISGNLIGPDIIASSFDLIKMRAVSENTLRRMIAASDLDYDFIFIDTPPTYDNLVLNALHASDMIITPVAFSQFDIKGCQFLKSQINRDTDKLPQWNILFNFFRKQRTDNPENQRNQYESLFRNVFSDYISPVVIPETTYVRKIIDAGEQLTATKQKAALHNAIKDLSEFCGATIRQGNTNG